MKRLKESSTNLTALVTVMALPLLIVGCSPSERDSTAESQRDASTTAGGAGQTPSVAGRNGYPTRAFFGDTHLHTSFSFDGGLFGATTTPEDAYRFARGDEVTASKGLQAKLARPLDFLVVADHAENLGFFKLLSAGDPKILAHPKGREWYEGFQAGGQAAVEASQDLVITYTGGFPDALQIKGEGVRPLWEEMIDAADKYNEPGKFTALTGYEWSSMPGGRNLHRVVVFADAGDRTRQVVPFSAQDSEDVEDLWDYMEAYERNTGGRVLAIPHNGNVSQGLMFDVETLSGEPLDRAYAERRMRYEPIYEVTQIKGDGEAHPYLSPADEFADFGTWDVGTITLNEAHEDRMFVGEYAREALKTGMALQNDIGANPFKFGMIGSTDAHTGLATADPDNWWGKHSGYEPGPERAKHDFAPPQPFGRWESWMLLSSGYAAVWATENTREALFEGMMRKETYATTGPRMTVRLFGGWDFSDADITSDFVQAGYERGVPMGGDLEPGAGNSAPTFIVAAMKDADGANLDRVQIVKGWVDARGETQEKVYDVAWSDGRSPNARGKVPAVGNTVNVAACTYENSIGASELTKVWTDPDFDAAQSAFYYVRVMEIPTPRWVAYDVCRYQAELPEEATNRLAAASSSAPAREAPPGSGRRRRRPNAGWGSRARARSRTLSGQHRSRDRSTPW